MTEEPLAAEKTITHIRIKGTLDAKWAGWFEGFVMTSRADGETLLSGAGIDQAALHGVLGKIHALGLPLLLLVQCSCPCPQTGCPRHGACADCAAWRSSRSRQPYCFRRGSEWDERCRQLRPL